MSAARGCSSRHGAVVVAEDGVLGIAGRGARRRTPRGSDRRDLRQVLRATAAGVRSFRRRTAALADEASAGRGRWRGLLPAARRQRHGMGRSRAAAPTRSAWRFRSLVVRDDVDDPGTPRTMAAARMCRAFVDHAATASTDGHAGKAARVHGRGHGASRRTGSPTLRRAVFEQQRPYAIVQADVPFELFQSCGIPAVSNEWWAALIAAKQMAPAYLDADGGRAATTTGCVVTAAWAWPARLTAIGGRGPWGGLPRPRLVVRAADVRLHRARLHAVGRSPRHRVHSSRQPGSHAAAAALVGAQPNIAGESWSSRTGWR